MDAFTKTDTMAPGAARRFRLMERTHDEPGRERLEQFVAETFAQAHGATVHAFMPSMLGLEDGGGRLRCVLGLRGAESGELFLERYLDRPIEESIAQAAGLDSAIPRGTIVEVGNLAGRGCRAAMHLVARLPLTSVRILPIFTPRRICSLMFARNADRQRRCGALQRLKENAPFAAR